MSKLGYFFGGILTGVLGLAGAAVLHDHLSSGSSSGCERSDNKSSDALDDTTLEDLEAAEAESLCAQTAEDSHSAPQTA